MKKIFILSLTLLFFMPEILADKRASRGECYISIGYVNDRVSVSDFAKNSFIKSTDFELFERKDKKVYLTLGKIDENLFKKLQSQNKTYNFNCSRGKGYEVRLGLNSEFQIIGGNKINIVSEEQFISVVSSIEREKQRLAKIAAEKEKAFSLGYNSVDDMNLAIAAGFEDASSFNSIANELNQAFEGSGLSKKEWLLALNSLGGKSLLNSYRSFQSKDEWSTWIETSYKVAANIPKLLLKCDDRGGYYLIAHTFAKKPSADFLYVKNGFNHARWEFYNRLATRLVINPNSYVYPDYTYNLTGTGLRYRGYKTDINRNNGSLRILHEYRSPFSSEWLKSSGIYNCSAFKNVKRYQNLKSDYIKFTKAEAVRKKEKAEAEAKAKLESRKF